MEDGGAAGKKSEGAEGAPAIDVKVELETMATIAKALDAVQADDAVVHRVLKWANERYAKDLKQPAKRTAASAASVKGDESTTGEPEFADLPSLFEAAQPTTEHEKALVVGYWFQVCQGQTDWTGYEVNSELKHLGHGVGNITDALDKLIERKPQLVIQTRKSGTSKQARKQYKLTTVGVARVKEMIAGTPEDEG